ncbi:MAG: hydrogenase 4 subunit B [Bacteroidota bacterium]
MKEITIVQKLLLEILFWGYCAGISLPLFLMKVGGSKVEHEISLSRLGKNLGLGFSTLASLSGCILSLTVLLTGTQYHFDFFHSAIFGDFSIQIDHLGAFFLLVISFLGVATSIYSIGYAEEYIGKRNVSLMVLLYNIFLLSMVAVVLSANAILFLMVWEVMSVSTFFLIVYEHEEATTRRAGILYIVMTHIGAAFLIFMFITLAGYSHSYNFDSFRNANAQIPPGVKTCIFLCALIGFGIKAGIMPLHIWLPEAHPAAPSNISALMSGVMIKTGIYGMIRVFFYFLDPGPEWWGILVLIIAVGSAVLGVLFALMEHDLKRLLAFHSIENIGIILMGLGAALLFNSFGSKGLAAVALIAGLYHTLNHATFKGLLFLGAGSVAQRTHTKNIEELGGLMKKLPWTSLFFLIGAVAISALPPLNGFVSEWLTFQALLLGFNIPELAVKLAVPITVALLALTGALAAACFVKAFGITFLGMARSNHVAEAHESPFSMLLAMGLLAIACFVFGIAPGMMISLMTPVTSSIFGENITGITLLNSGALTIPERAGSGVSPLILLAFFGGLLLFPIVVGFIMGGRMRKRQAMVWACGLEKLNSRMEYTATGFSKPIRMIFSNIFRATHEIEISEETSAFYKPQIRVELKTESIFHKYLYEPLRRITIDLAKYARRIQTGHIQSYLAYIFIVLIILLLFAR